MNGFAFMLALAVVALALRAQSLQAMFPVVVLLSVREGGTVFAMVEFEVVERPQAESSAAGPHVASLVVGVSQ